MAVSLNRRIPVPTGRLVESKAQVQDRVMTYTFRKGSLVFTVVGYDTPQEAFMLRIAWDFYTHAKDYGSGSLPRSRTNHFEMFARFFVNDNIGRKVPGLFVFLRDAQTIRDHRRDFWPVGHPNDVGVDLNQCVFNMELLASNIDWYVDLETRFWNTLEFRIGELDAAFAQSLHDDYRLWLEQYGLKPNIGYLAEPVATFNDAAMRTRHPFFTNKAGRLNPSLWDAHRESKSSTETLPRRGSPEKRKQGPPSSDSTGSMQLALFGASASHIESPLPGQDASKRQLVEEEQKRGPSLPLVAVDSSNNVPASMELDPVASGNAALLRTMDVPQCGINEGSAPMVAFIYKNSIVLKDPYDNKEYTLQPPHGVSNTGDNIIAIVNNTVQEGNEESRQVILVMIVAEEKTPALVVRNHTNVKRQGVRNDDSRTLLVSAGPKTSCVSHDGRRVVVNDGMPNLAGYWTHVLDLVTDADTTMLKLEKSAARTTDPVLACTRSVFATRNGFFLGNITALKPVTLNVPQEQGLTFLSVSTNAWMQASARVQGLDEARKHTVFVHLYERKEYGLLAIVTPLTEDGVDVGQSFSVEHQLPRGFPRRSANDDSVSHVLWYPLPSYASLAMDQLTGPNIDTTKDQALVVWCIHKNFALVTTAPVVGPDMDQHVSPVTLASAYMPKPILNNLSLQVFDSDFNTINLLDFTSLVDFLASLNPGS